MIKPSNHKELEAKEILAPWNPCLILHVVPLDWGLSVLSTTHSKVSSDLSPNYTSLEAKEILAPKMLSCHSMPYPYAVYYCHYQESATKAFKVSLGGDNGDKVEAAAVCHMDTSGWSPDHISLRLLRVKPGACPVCHFLPPGHLVWAQSPTIT